MPTRLRRRQFWPGHVCGWWGHHHGYGYGPYPGPPTPPFWGMGRMTAREEKEELEDRVEALKEELRYAEEQLKELTKTAE